MSSPSVLSSPSPPQAPPSAVDGGLPTAADGGSPPSVPGTRSGLGFSSLSYAALAALPAKHRLGAVLGTASCALGGTDPHPIQPIGAAAPLTVRVAPSPTGRIHVGTLRVALHNALAAQAGGGRLLLRIDDTDAARHQDDAVDLIRTALDRFGVRFDHAFLQSDRRDAHRSAVQRLLDTGWAVADPTDRGAVRLSQQANDLMPAAVFDLGAGLYPISPTLAGHADGLVLLRSDGSPTYHLGSVVDDIDHAVTLVLRGADHLANTPKQILIALALARAGHPHADVFCDRMVFGHSGLLMHNGAKLSKRDGASDGLAWIDQVGADALRHGLLTLGWGHPDPQFGRVHPTLDGAVMPDVFAQGALRAANCQFDAAKIWALARKYLGRR